MLESLVAWTETTLMPFGFSGVGILAFMESAFFPVPPDVLLIPLVIMDPANAFAYALVTTLFSTLGSFLGWQIGRAGGKPLLKKFVSRENMEKANALFKKYGAWSLVVTGFTPIPYKVFTITAGALDYDSLPAFLIACTIGRGARFFIEAALFFYFGNEILALFTEYFGIATISIAAAVVIGALLFQKHRRRKRA